MPSFSDSELPVSRAQRQAEKKEQRPRPRRFFRRGAVTELVDPSAGDPKLQGIIPADWSSEPLPTLRPRPLKRQPPPRNPPRMDETPGRPMPRAHVRFRIMANSALWLSVSLALIAAAVTVWALASHVCICCPRLPLPWRWTAHVIRAGEGPNGQFRIWRPWMEGFDEAFGIIVKSVLIVWGGLSVITKGTRCLVEFIPQRSFPREALHNDVVMDKLALVGFAVFPTAISAAFTTLIPGGFCNPEHNINRFLPPRTRDDIKSILEGWLALVMVHSRTGMSVQQIKKWKITVWRVLAWLIGVAVWTTVEIRMGPCWYFPRVWSVWFSILSISIASWFVGNAEVLIVTEWESVGKAHIELLVYLSTFYMARWVDLDGYCVKPSCW